MSLLFNAVVGLGFVLYPQEYTPMFPREIKKAAAPYVNKKNERKVKLIIYSLYLFLFVFWAVSAHFAGIAYPFLCVITAGVFTLIHTLSS